MSALAETDPPQRCAKQDCTASNGGPCQIGHDDPHDCPNADFDLVAPDTTVKADEPVPAASKDQAGLTLSGGEALTVEQAGALAARQPTELIVPLGPPDVGKTTLLVELYARFLRGPWAGREFTASRTLVAFERLAFPSRLRDRETLPTTWRTRPDEQGRMLMHLTLKSTDRQDATPLLFADLPGELTSNVVDGADPYEQLPIMRSATALLILVDGDKLAQPATAHRAVSATRQLVRMLAEAAPLPENARIAVAVTKLDRLIAGEGDALGAWEAAREGLDVELARLDRPVTHLTTAARRLTPTAIQDDGMSALLNWACRGSRVNAPPPAETTTAPERSFGRYEGGP